MDEFMKDLLGQDTIVASTQTDAPPPEKTAEAAPIPSTAVTTTTRKSHRRRSRSKSTDGTHRRRKSKRARLRQATVVPEVEAEVPSTLTVAVGADVSGNTSSAATMPPPAKVDMAKGAAERTGQSKRKTASAEAAAAAIYNPRTRRRRQKRKSFRAPGSEKTPQRSSSPSTTKDRSRKKSKRAKLSASASDRPQGRQEPDASAPAVVQRLRDTARQSLPADDADRIVASTTASYLGTDSLKEEDKATLPSLVRKTGTPIVVVVAAVEGGGATATVQMAHKIANVADLESVVGSATPAAAAVCGVSEAQARRSLGSEEAGGLPPTREFSKNQGYTKTAGLGLRVPAPGNRASKLRRKVAASSMSHPNLQQQQQHAEGEEGPLLDPPIPDAGHAVEPDGPADETAWETTPAQQLADEADARRMDVAPSATAAPSGMVRPISELTKVYTDQHRVTQGDLRTAVARYIEGIQADRLFRVEMTDRMREGHDPHEAAQAAESATANRVSRRRPRAGATLVMDECEEDVLRALCCEPDGPARGSGVGDDDDDDENHSTTVLRDRMEAWMRTPLDDLEVAVLLGTRPDDTLAYLMAFDDPRALVKRLYETAMRTAGMVGSASLLCGPETGHSGVTSERRQGDALYALDQAEQQICAEWDGLEGGVGVGDAGIDTESVLELYTRRASVRMMRSVLTGDLDGQRLNMVRAAVAREEFLAGLYGEPAMRCFLGPSSSSSTATSGQQQQQQQQREFTDRDVIKTMRNKLAAMANSQKQQQKHTTAGEPSWRSYLPKLGTPASKAYCADFLRQADPTQQLERPCISGRRFCVAWWMVSHGGWPATGALNRANGAYVMREFYPPDAWTKIQQEDALPSLRTQCLLCKRFRAKYHWVQLCLLDANSRCVLHPQQQQQQQQQHTDGSDHVFLGALLGQDHCNAIDPEGGYTDADMLPVGRPGDGSWVGVMAPIVALCFNRYVPGKCRPPIDITARAGQSPSTAAAAAAAGQQQRPELPCFFEQSASDFS